MRVSESGSVRVCKQEDEGSTYVRHILTIAQFDCTSYPTGAHSDPVLRLWDGGTNSEASLFYRIFLSWNHYISLPGLFSLFFNSRAKSSVCNLSLGFSFAFGVHHTRN